MWRLVKWTQASWTRWRERGENKKGFGSVWLNNGFGYLTVFRGQIAHCAVRAHMHFEYFMKHSRARGASPRRHKLEYIFIYACLRAQVCRSCDCDTNCLQSAWTAKWQTRFQPLNLKSCETNNFANGNACSRKVYIFNYKPKLTHSF